MAAARQKPSAGLVPSKLYSTDFSKALGTPGKLKSHEWLLLAGPVGKYALHGRLHGKEAKLVFAYLDFLGSLWANTFKCSSLDQLVSSGQQLLA